MARLAIVGEGTGSISADERAFLAAKARRGERNVSHRQDSDLLRELTSDAYGMVHRMVRKGLLIPVAPGAFLIAPETGGTLIEQAGPLQLALHARLSPYTDYFLSYFSGLQEHGLTDLDDPTLYVAVSPSAPRHVEIAGRNVVMTRIVAPKKWFGIEAVKIGQGRRVPTYQRATIERTLLDTLDRPRLCGSQEIVVRAWERAFREGRADPEQLAESAPGLGFSVARRAGFWLSRTGEERAASALTGHLGTTRVPILLDASKEYGPGDWPVDREWGVVINVPAKAYQGWIAYSK